MAYYTTIVPLKFQDNLLSLTDPLSLEVWISFFICIPIYIGALMLMNYVYSGSTNWEASASFVIRVVLSDCKSKDVKPPKQLYLKLLVIMWGWMMLVLISAYQGNLLAMITKPTMKTPFTNVEGMVEQTQVKWAYPLGLFPSYAKSKPPGTALRKVIDEAFSSFTYCSWIEEKSEDIAALCDITDAISVMAKDFSKTGTCNYYLTQDKILASDSALAFQVHKTM